ncbi:hypothetical protein M514_03375 [Trichuris suis]|uniref:Uncharacterized protein n=1 Tax=Trichuris suis TaxID=68888 RepID=A0A085MEI1_9BILA|nr:hypothetical protein M513_03375 [Trichuris suis]KFD68039.1 hypothetical protein M514_03375 [Trichuris suis]
METVNVAFPRVIQVAHRKDACQLNRWHRKHNAYRGRNRPHSVSAAALEENGQDTVFSGAYLPALPHWSRL